MKIKRPLFIIALSILVVIYAINTMPGSIVYASLALFALFTIFHAVTQKKYSQHLVLFLIAGLIGTAYFNVFNIRLAEKIKSFEAMENITITGEITAKSPSNGISNYTVKTKTVNGEKFNGFKVSVYSGDVLEIGDFLEMSGKYKSFTRKSNYIYQYSQGVFGYFNADKTAVIDDVSTFSGFFSNLRTALIDKTRKIFAYDTVPIAVAMGIGDKSLLDESVVNAFSFTGITHALVVSGLHVSFISMVINGLLYFIPVKKKLKNIVSMIAVFIFMGIAGFTPSIIRAGVLLIAITIGRNLIVEVDNYTVLAAVILITLFINPYSANNASLLLSYTAYFGVIHRADLAMEKEWGSIRTSLLMAVFAVLYTSPVTAMLGMDATLFSPVFNLLLSFPVMVVCVLSFFLPVFSFVPVIGNILVLALAPVNELLIRFLLLVTSLSEKYLSFAMINMGTEQVKVIVFSALIAVTVALIQFENINIKRFFIIAVPICSLLCYNYLTRDMATVQIFDGSSNPSYLISYNDSNCLVVSENINSNRFSQITDRLGTERFDEIIVCSKKAADTEMYLSYTDNLQIADHTGEYTSHILKVNADINNRKYSYIIDVGGVSFAFTHNKTDISEIPVNFYFFGADTPQDVNAAHYFYFYPVIKKNTEITQEKQAAELYDTLTVKVNLSTGQYYIVEDVKNYGGRI